MSVCENGDGKGERERECAGKTEPEKEEAGGEICNAEFYCTESHQYFAHSVYDERMYLFNQYRVLFLLSN